MCLARRLGVYPTPSGPGDPGAVWIYLGKYPLPKTAYMYVTKGKGRTAGGRDMREEIVLGLSRPPRCAAVSLTVRDGSCFTYREAKSIVRREIKLSELDIKELRLRKAVTGAMLFEISGQDAGSKASRLAERMTATLKELPVKVTVPRRTAELRMTGLEDLVTPREVAAAVAEARGCRADEVCVGPIHYAPRGLGSVWLRSPLTEARKINRGGDARSGGKINIGWSTARVTPLPARQLQCFRCMESGHVGKDCKSAVDRSERCYRFGAEGYRAFLRYRIHIVPGSPRTNRGWRKCPTIAQGTQCLALWIS